jgi:hypothetical protein
MHDDQRPTAVSGDRTAVQRKRRSLFASVLGLIFLPALVASVLPDAQATETVYVAGGEEPIGVSDTPTTGSTATTTTVAPPTTAAPSTTSKPRPSTTTTRPKPATTTTTAPKSAPRATAAPAPAPAPVAPSAAPVANGSGPTASEAAFLACVRQRESGGNYSVVSSNGLWFGAYQMTRQTWDSTARRAGRHDLVGVPPNQASPGDQDWLALVLYRWLGKSPWGGAC